MIYHQAEKEKLRQCVEGLLTSYRALRNQAGERLLWNETPKFHDLWHVLSTAQHTNPRWQWCYPDEDFMRIVKARLTNIPEQQ